MALTEVSLQNHKTLTLPANLSSKPSNPLRAINSRRCLTLQQLRRSPRITCSVAPNQVQPLVVPAVPADVASNRECFGVFCSLYDLKAEEKTKSWKSLVKIAVSGAAGMISNHLLFKLASGEVFGQDQPIALRLLGSERSFQALEGVAMELEDFLFPLLREVNISIDPYEVFRDAEWALLIGAKPRGPGIERAALLDINGQIFAEQVKEEAQQLAQVFQTVGAFKVKRKGGKGKLIFGTVTAQDLVDIIKAQLQRDVDKRIVSLPEIRETGEYVAELKLHPEVTAQVRVNVFAN